MSRFIMLAAIGALLFGAYGYFKARSEGQFSIPDGVKAIECQKDSKYLAPEGQDIFKLNGTTMAFACEKRGNGKMTAKRWAMGKEPGPGQTLIDKIGSYYFRKQPDGRFSRTDDALSPSPDSAYSRYAVIATFRGEAPKPFDQDIFGRNWEMQLPTPNAFALTGPATTFWCQDPSIHPQMRHQCVARVQTKGLWWHIQVVFGKPLRNEIGEIVRDRDNFDMRPEVAEAYNLLAAHILKQE